VENNGRPDRISEPSMDIEQLAKISRALADPTRLRIYEAIAARNEIYCGELVEMEGLAPGTVSHHLKVLAEAELIDSRREGQFIYNRATPETMKRYAETLAKLGRRR
jgi:ArsR family transcriptional regulator, arsenate/arsenite/antimonite-responsive transcriptional repressor